jgi:Fic family protein
LYRAFADETIESNPQTKEVLFYKDALWHGYNALKSDNRLLTTPLFTELVQILKNTALNIRKIPGTQLVNSSKEVMYTPPEGEDLIRQKLSRLERFIHTDHSLDPLIQMALIHYQFEAIHPFPDGNGRTGRILNILFLIQKGLLDIPVLYLSKYIISNKSAYYKGLRSVTEEHKWEEWILYILEGLEQTAIATRQQIILIHRLTQETAREVKEKLPRIYSKDLIEILFRSPYCKIKMLEEGGIAKRQTASTYLQQLEKIGLLRSLKLGRDIYYVNDRFLNVLTG